MNKKKMSSHAWYKIFVYVAMIDRSVSCLQCGSCYDEGNTACGKGSCRKADEAGHNQETGGKLI